MDPMGYMCMFTRIQCEAPKVSKLVQKTPITMVFGTYNELVTGAFVNQRSHHNGGPHIVYVYIHTYMIHMTYNIPGHLTVA